MLQIHTTQRLHQIELSLGMAAERHGGSVLASSHVGQLLKPEDGLGDADAITFTLCFSSLYAELLRFDIRTAAFLPIRVAACAMGEGSVLEAVSPRGYCSLLQRPEIGPVAAKLEDVLRLVMEEAAHGMPHEAGELAGGHAATEDQINMRASVPQRIDGHGTKVEDLAGTGVHDAQGG